ncbi:MAG: CPBP family intramembrane metalloprotease [Lachnospiraceae bacterium]|nr:CPBP family intramembrane metalloprotease [Lachnospiraceae bacterium]
MDLKFKQPDMVKEAARTGGKNIVIEILMFIGVFFVVQMIMSMIFLVPELVILLSTTDFLAVVMSGDMQQAIEMEMAVITSEPMMIVQLFLTAVMIVITLLFCKLLQKRKMRTLGFKKPGMWKEYGIGMLVGLGMMTAIVLVGVALGAMELRFNENLLSAGSIMLLVLLFVGFLIQGMSEEVLCRGYFLVSLARKKGNTWLPIIISSVAFGALHLANSGIAPLAFVNLILFGIFAGLYFIKRGNIWGIAAIHSIWNFAQGNIYGILVSGNNFGTTVFTSTIDENMTFINGGDFGLEGGILTTIVLLGGTLIMMCTKQKDCAASDESTDSAMAV